MDVIVTGSSGLVGSACVRLFTRRGFRVFGIDNGMRKQFFGAEGDNHKTLIQLQRECPDFVSYTGDIRDPSLMSALFQAHGKDLAAVIHCAGQPSHDWAAQDPQTDFGVNALGTLNLLEAARLNAHQAAFIFMSTNKVYGDKPNDFPNEEMPTRYNIPGIKGFSESLGLDFTMHSLFGTSKASADLMVQEYGHYFGMKTVCLRAGCITGGEHAGAEQHGFLSYLIKCCATGQPYHVYGYKGKQVRDNIHSDDLAEAIFSIAEDPGVGEVYNIGGESENSISILEAIHKAEEVTGKKLNWDYNDQARLGDHQWYVTDMTRFRQDYPGWHPQFCLDDIFEDIVRGID